MSSVLAGLAWPDTQMGGSTVAAELDASGFCDPGNVQKAAHERAVPALEEGAAGTSSASSPAVQVLEVISDLLLEVGEAAPEDAFFDRLCAAICSLAAMRRAVLFRYDAPRRRVRLAGAHGIDGATFAELFVTVESVPVAKMALSLDSVLETTGGEDFDVPAPVRELVEGVRIVCTPMVAAGNFVGVVMSEREYGAPPLTDADRQLLWTLGKSIAMASVAREAAFQNERSRQLQQRINLAREVHEEVVQRLFGVSLALSREEPLDNTAQQRCAAEVQAALGDLRTALQRPLGRSARIAGSTFVEELASQRGLAPGLEIALDGDVEAIPAEAGDLAQSLLIEAVRNARKHAKAQTVWVRLQADESTFVMEVENDGLNLRPRRRGVGMGLHLLTLEALQQGGVLEYGEGEPRRWSVRLVLPIGADQ